MLPTPSDHGLRGHVLVCLALLCSCRPAPLAPTNVRPEPASERQCRHDLKELEPDAATPAAPLDPLRDPLFRSSIVVTVERSLDGFASALAGAVPVNASASRINVGSAGRLSYSAQRSPFSAAVRDRAIHFTSQLTAQAELCKPLGVLGCVSYAQCAPGAVADASFALEPDASWWLGPASLRVVITRPCVIGPIDATPMIQRGANQQASALRSRLNPAVPSLHEPVSALWHGARLLLPVAGRTLRFHPSTVEVGTATVRGSTASWPVSLSGGISSAPLASNRELPPPTTDPRLVPGFLLTVPITIPLDTLVVSLRKSLVGLPLAAGTLRAHVESVDVFLASDGVRLLLGLRGDLCGSIPLVASPLLVGSPPSIQLSAVGISVRARASLARLAPQLDQRSLVREVQQRASIEIPVSPDELRQSVAAAVDGLRVAGATRTGTVSAAARFELLALSSDGIVVLARVEQRTELVLR